MSYFAIYVPPSKAVFEGTVAQCAGSIAAVSIKLLDSARSGLGSGSGSGSAGLPVPVEDAEYPPDSPLWLIFAEKTKALSVLRHFKDGRLREFPNQEQAESFVQYGFESIESLKRFGKPKTPSSKSISIAFKNSPNSADNSHTSYSPTGSSSSSSSGFASMCSLHLSSPPAPLPLSNGRQQQLDGGGGERPQFRAPSKHELQEFRKQIERGNYEKVKRIVWDNPRFLISSGDTPTWLTEGCRYNAIHICAQENQAQIAELLLKTISDREFTQLFAGKKGTDPKFFSALNASLLDFYLNMPDSVRGETPLHFAVKLGYANVVEVLIAYPQCKLLKNIDGQVPQDLIGQRPTLEANRKLRVLMCDPHYVPALRSVANELPPQVGKPFSVNEPPNLEAKDECGVLSTQLYISALAGPMSRDMAINFYKRWKTPTQGGSIVKPSMSSPVSMPQPPHRPTRRLANGRLNPISSWRCLRLPAKQSSAPMANGTPSEDNNNDMKMPDTHSAGDGTILDRSLRNLRTGNRSQIDGYRERHIKNSDIEKGLEVVGRQLASQEHLEWGEYWDFLDAFLDISTPEGLDRLEAYLVDRSERSKDMLDFSQLCQCLDLVASEQQQQQPQLDKSSTSTAEVVPAITEFQTPYTCVEKSLQVFAKRITKTLIMNIKEVTINDMLLSELKRLKTLVASFKIDARFTHVDFSKVHSRIAHLVASYVYDSQEVNVAMLLLLFQMLRKSLKLQAADERGREQHLGCWCSSLLEKLEQGPAAAAVAVHNLPDALNTEELYINAWEAEHSCPCQWVVQNLSRKSSRRKRTESLRAAVAAAAVASASAAEDSDHEKMLYYDCDETLPVGDGTSSEEENFRTPPESMTPQWVYQLYINGKEPTKRDVDVLNALINVELDKETRPRVYAWLTNMKSFSAAEMALFPSTKIVQKTIKPAGLNKAWNHRPSTKPIAAIPATPILGSFGGIAKGGRRASPNLSIQPAAGAINISSPVLSFRTLAAVAHTFPTPQTFHTPLHKQRGMFSK